MKKSRIYWYLLAIFLVYREYFDVFSVNIFCCPAGWLPEKNKCLVFKHYWNSKTNTFIYKVTWEKYWLFTEMTWYLRLSNKYLNLIKSCVYRCDSPSIWWYVVFSYASTGTGIVRFMFLWRIKALYQTVVVIWPFISTVDEHSMPSSFVLSDISE